MRLKNKIKKIIDAIKDTDINEIEISNFWGGQKIKLKKGTNLNSAKADTFSTPTVIPNENIDEPTSTKHNVEEDYIEKEIEDNNYTTIKAPLVGTFYLSPKPGQPQFINIDSKISVGDTLCIVEAMKIFNEIESDYSGVIKEILVNDGEPVEYDQPLFKIEETDV